MTALQQFMSALQSGTIEVVDLTAPLLDTTPILQLPDPFGNTVPFRLEEISRYDDRGPAWYWNNIHTGEHTGTHFDAPVHWITGRDGQDVSQVPVGSMLAPVAVLDVSEQVAKDPDFLVEVSHIKAWESEHGSLPEGGWLIIRTGWEAQTGDQDSALNVDESGSHTPGASPACAKWLAEEAPIIGMGVETVGTDAGLAGGFDPPFPCHSGLLGAGKYGLTQLQNVGRLPATGAVLVTAPLPIVGGSGSPARVLALIDHGA